MHEHVAPAVYYLEVHLLYASIVCLAAWVLASLWKGNASWFKREVVDRLAPAPNDPRSADAAFHENGCRVVVGAGASVSGEAWRLYTRGRRLRESGVLFALKARLTTQAVRNNITTQATIVTVTASSASA